MSSLFNDFENLKGAKFITVNGYEAKGTGEISNFTVLVNVDIENAKKGDLEKLQAIKDSDLIIISESKGIDIDTCKTALAELINSAIKNLDPVKENRSNQSQGQTDAYITISKGLRYHKESLTTHIFSMRIKKEVLKAGTYKKRNSQPKTIAKEAIKKEFDLRSHMLRTFIIPNTENVKISGSSHDLK